MYLSFERRNREFAPSVRSEGLHRDNLFNKETIHAEYHPL